MKKINRLFCFALCFLIIFLLMAASASAAVTEAQTPISADETQLKWSIKLGSSYRDAPSVPAVSGNYVYVMSCNMLYKLNAQNGETAKSAEMTDEPSFSYTPVLIDDGKIFCPLEDGTVQAFDKNTLSSVWIYNDSLGGQALTPIVYYGGCIYTGFWNDEELDANFVCLDAKTGTLKWKFTHKGGFYWSECYVNDKYVIVGGDNSSGDVNAKGLLHCFDRLTGKLLDTAEIIGDQRSGITFSGGKLYFVTKAGYLYKTFVDSNGNFGTLNYLKLSGASTSTPVIYNNRIYIGVQSQRFGGCLNVIDTEKMSLIYSASLNGYPQSEMLLSNAYESHTGKVYIYSTYNAAPGGITVITDSIGQTKAVTEHLYIPSEGSQSYCISSVSVGTDGTLYYKNDSGTIFAVETIKEQPVESEKSIFKIIIEVFILVINLIVGIFA